MLLVARRRERRPAPLASSVHLCVQRASLLPSCLQHELQEAQSSSRNAGRLPPAGGQAAAAAATMTAMPGMQGGYDPEAAAQAMAAAGAPAQGALASPLWRCSCPAL